MMKNETLIEELELILPKILIFDFLGKTYLACVEQKGDMTLRIFEYLPRRACDVLKVKASEKIIFQTGVSDLYFHENKIIVVDESLDIFIVQLGTYFHMN